MSWMSADSDFWTKVIKTDKEDIKRYGVSSFGPYDDDDDDDEDYDDDEWED